MEFPFGTVSRRKCYLVVVGCRAFHCVPDNQSHICKEALSRRMPSGCDRIGGNNMNDHKLVTGKYLEEKYGLPTGYLKKLRVQGGGCPFHVLPVHRIRYVEVVFVEWLNATQFNSTSQYQAKLKKPGRDGKNFAV
jgi:hypothetical protein